MSDIDKRSEEILSSLISAFTQSGRPVGSAILAKYLGNRFSSALIRSVMNDLERLGLLMHRHTSGGRVPTDKGLRYFVDKLLKIKELDDNCVSDIKSRFKDNSYSVDDVFKRTSNILSTLSNFAGLIVSPLVDEITVKHIEFISLSKDRVLGIFVGRDGQVENRVIKSKNRLNYSDLEKINNYCSRAFYGLTLSEAKDKVAKELYAAKRAYDDMIGKALILSNDMFQDVESARLFIDGGSKLLSMPEFFDTEKAASIIDALEEKRKLIDILNSTLESDSIKVFIGSESGYDAMSDCSVVSASYKKDGKVLGTLGVIGPTRMDYSKVIPIVDCTAGVISNFMDGEDLYDG